MRMPDVNILIYAHRKESKDHDFYCSWMETLLNGPSPFALSPLVAVAFVRIITHPSFSPNPTPLLQALTYIDTLLSSDYCYQPELGKNHWRLVKYLCESTSATEKLVADAQHAALAIEHGCTFVTRDNDFEKFKPFGLRVEKLVPTS